MKITEKINSAIKDQRCFWSFEYFPPKTEAGCLNLYDRMQRMQLLGPEFIDVTWNAGGNSSGVTMDICRTAHEVYGLETCMHLTCTNMPREKIDAALKQAKEVGLQNILALRGDPPRGQDWKSVDTGFSYAIDLVKYIREKYGDYFCIGVAGYPEGHSDNPSKEDDLLHLKEKVDAGADYIVTQLFYDSNIFVSWYKKCREIGIKIPILPGMMPIQNYAGFKRMTSLCKTYVPDEILTALEPIKDDDKKVKEFGIDLAVDMCLKIKKEGIYGFHFYTLNLERSTKLILEKLNFIASPDLAKPLPWKQSLSKSRQGENVRPIFWHNRPMSYINRTSEWDEFPNGRWGDSRSPAFGDIDGHSVPIKYSSTEALTMWGNPKTEDDISNLFVAYCRGDLYALPWSDSPLAAESEFIQSRLIDLNNRGYLTINSQPAVNGAASSHPAYGWGPKNGFVFQKAYLEFFVSPKTIQKLVDKIGQNPHVTYYAVNSDGDFRTNTNGESANAVTWGVFPGQEIAQPTVVEANSFMAWKDEAFQLWNEWSNLYSLESHTHKLLEEINQSWFLMNIVDNNFQNTDTFFAFLDDI